MDQISSEKEKQSLDEVAAQALEREGFAEAGPDFSFAEVDCVTRWSVAVALEEAAGRTIPDEKIRAAGTVRELVDLFEL